jgi:hypothetical protein
LKSDSLNLLEAYGPVQAFNGIALPLPIKFIPSVKIGQMEGTTNTHSTVFWYTSSFLLRNQCEIKIKNASRYLITFVTIHYHPPTNILSFVGHGDKFSTFSMQL